MFRFDAHQLPIAHDLGCGAVLYDHCDELGLSMENLLRFIRPAFCIEIEGERSV